MADEINLTKPFYMDLLNKFVHDVPAMPIGPNYQSGRKLLAEECLAAGKDLECTFHLSESVSATLRTLAIYREDQLKSNNNEFYAITRVFNPILKRIIDSNPISKEEEDLLESISFNKYDLTEKFEIEEKLPFHRQYLRFSTENNVANFQRILKELPEEWTIIQITAPYNPNENIKPFTEYRKEINELYLSIFTNDYLEDDVGPFTISVPANVTKEGEKPLFTELYSLLDANLQTLENAQYFIDKRIIRNYWDRREDVDLRMKSVINVMDKEWLGGWCSLLTGKLIDTELRSRVVKFVDDTITDSGFIKLTRKQRILLYNLIDTCPNLSLLQIKSCIRQILTEHGNISDVLENIPQCCKYAKAVKQACFKCLTRSFKSVHKLTLTEGINVFFKAAKCVREDDEWNVLRKAKRQPVILIIDEILDTFPWESLPVLSQHPVSRIENIHLLYYLYKTHETRIVNGYFQAKADVGRYVINPDKTLARMEKRMSAFVEYWCESWEGKIGEPPTPEDYLKYLKESDIFLYCGHGSGCQFASGGASVESTLGIAGVTILAGCGSVRLAHPPGRGAPTGPHHHFHIAGSPMVVGMLWEVTDLEVDKVVSTLISHYVPSKASAPWHKVGKDKWTQGILDTTTKQKTSITTEPNLLLALSRARKSTNFVMIASSVVARGLPIRIGDCHTC